MAKNTVRVSILGDAKDLQRAFGDAEKSSKSFASKFKNDTEILAKWAKRGALAIGAIVGAVVGLAAKGGIDRLMGLERASKKLKQLGVAGEDADGLMESLLKTLLDTPFALDKGAESIAGFVASGRDIKDIPRLIDQVTDAAAFGNTTLDEMDIIWRRIQTTGRASNEELLLLAQRQIPVYEQLAAGLGVTGAEVRQLASDGEISADIFFDAWQRAADGSVEGSVRIAGSAKAMGDTTEGAWANMRTAMSRFGATLLEDIFPLAKDLFTAIGEGFDNMGRVLKSAFDDFDPSGFEDFIEGVPQMMEKAAEGFVTLWESTELLREAFRLFASGAGFLIQDRMVQLIAMGWGVVKVLDAMKAHPVIAGVGLVLAGFGYIQDQINETRGGIEELIAGFDELGVAARENSLRELFTDREIARLERAGITLRDLADGTVTWSEAARIAEEDAKGLFGKVAHTDAVYHGLAQKLDMAAEAQENHTNATRLEEIALSDANVELRKYEGAQLDLAAATDEGKKATEEATTALQDFENEVRSQTDPLFAYREATRKVGEAQVAANAARDEFGEGSAEHIDALLGVAEAGYDLEAAMIRVAEQSNLTRSQFETQLKQMGLFTDQQIQDMLDEFERINAFKFSDKSIRINTTGSGSLIGPDYAAAHGGSFKAGDTVLVGEEGPEIWKPKTAGDIIPIGNGGGGSAIGGSLVVNVYGSILTENDLIDAIHQGLLKKQKRNGNLGLAG